MEIIDGYKYIKELDETNVSQVILAEKSGVKYILKMARKKEYNHLIDREYALLKYLRDTNLTPRPFSIGTFKNKRYLVREYIKGNTLKDFLEDKPFHIIDDYFKEALYLLFKFHTHGIVLRDISPTNFFITDENKLYVIDVGMALLYKEKTSLEGTPKYLAPESILNEDFSFKSDLFSLGVMFYEFYKKKAPYDVSNLDALLIEQSHGPPSLEGIPKVPAKLIEKLLQFDPDKRPVSLEAIKLLDDAPQIERLVVNKSFPVIFSTQIEQIISEVKDRKVKILNVFHPRFPENFFSYIFKELKLRLEIQGFKTSTHLFTEESDIILTDYTYFDIQWANMLKEKQKLIIFSLKPLNIKGVAVDYMNMIINPEIDAFLEDIIPVPKTSVEFEDPIPLYAKINLKILKYIIPDDFPIQNDILKDIASYLNAEYNDLLDLLSSFHFALPKSLIYTELGKIKTEKIAETKEQLYSSILRFMELFGFIETTETHVILLHPFNTLLRSKEMKKEKSLFYKKGVTNIYDNLEYLIYKVQKEGITATKLKELLRGNKVPPTHARIFLDALYQAVPSSLVKKEVLKAKISLGLWHNVIKDWEKIAKDIIKSSKKLAFDYIRLSISLGRFYQSIELLKKYHEPPFTSLLLYTYALYSKFDLFLDTLKKYNLDKENPYYHLAMAFFQLVHNQNPHLAKNHAVRASELAGDNPHVNMVSTYIYAVSLLKFKKIERAKNLLESITDKEEFGIESLLINFQLGYIYYLNREFLKGIYYFEYAYYMAREFQNISLSVQAAFYLSAIYYRVNKLNIAEYYIDYAYKHRQLLKREQIDLLIKNYVNLTLYLKTPEKIKNIALLVKKNPKIEKLFSPIILAKIYYLIGEKEKLEKLKKESEKMEEKAFAGMLLEMMKIERKSKEV